ncbi:Eco57I restriction-modification methylase domain-containing protein [Capnocytophaga bilenii]
MTKTELRQIFQAPYNQKTWGHSLHFLSGNNDRLQLFLAPKSITLYTNEATKLVKSFHQLGKLRTNDDVEFPIYEVILNNKVQISHNKVTVNNFVKKYIVNDAIEGALVTYAYEDTDRKEWRFSFISKNTASDFFAEAESIETNPRKYTYVFGTDELHTTAVERFFTLQQSNFEVKDFFAAFEVEALNKEFFEEYKAIYEDFVEHITGKRFVKEKGKWVEKEKHLPDPQYLSPFGEDDKCVRDYVKKLLGRLVFLYFLQKKEWLNGDVNYLKNLFGKSDKTSFLEEVLEPLFFGVLNTKPEDRRALFEAEQWNLSLLKEWEKVPYLNGGLFERDIIDNERVIFSEELFERTFEFFSRYNFTIDENDPEDTQIGIDPEMLGKIFENLLEDNKDKGAFYTPKEIVQYMCRESLIAYLTEKHKEEEVNIRDLVEKHNTKWEEDTCKKVLNSLKEVKICDPAIGSGAFPMGMLNELYKCRIALGEEKSVNIKKEILQNNIYGVDIEKGAVDIARLRFWLALVVDESIPEPLPNLDFKIMQGNSLLESYQGVDLSNLTAENNNLMLVENSQKDLFGNYVEPQLKITFTKKDFTESLQQDIKKYFSVTDAETKKRLRKQINNKIQEHIDYNLELRRNHLERLKLEITPKYKNDILTLKQEREKESLEQEIAKLDISRKEIIKLQETDEKPFFLWHIYFADVFKGANNLNNSGFDIVIGNPPYGAKLSQEDKEVLKKKYISAQTIKGIQKGSLDTYTLFIELGYNLLKKGGNLGFIVPLSVTSSDALSGLHNLLINNCEVIKISSYGDRPKKVFESAEQQVSIVSFLKTQTEAKKILMTGINKRYSDDSLWVLLDNLKFSNAIGLLSYGRIPKIGTNIEQVILRKLLKNNNLLSNLKTEKGSSIYYRKAGGRYYKIVTKEPTESSAEGSITIENRYLDLVGAILSSNLFYWFWLIHSDWHNMRTSEIENFPIPYNDFNDKKIEQISKLYNIYLADLKKNAKKTVTGLNVFVARKSKHIIDQIDDLICPLYGLTQEETDFIKNYEIVFRLSDND